MTLYGARGEAGGPEMPDGISVHSSPGEQKETTPDKRGVLFYFAEFLLNGLRLLVVVGVIRFLVWWLAS